MKMFAVIGSSYIHPTENGRTRIPIAYPIGYDPNEFTNASERLFFLESFGFVSAMGVIVLARSYSCQPMTSFLGTALINFISSTFHMPLVFRQLHHQTRELFAENRPGELGLSFLPPILRSCIVFV